MITLKNVENKPKKCKKSFRRMGEREKKKEEEILHMK